MKRVFTITTIIVILLLIIGIFYLFLIFSSKEQKNITVKLISIEEAENSTGGNFIESGGYYAGKLNLKDLKNNREYSIYVCSKDWLWVKEGECYTINLDDINKNIKQHEYSMELSGCYVGILDKISC